MSRQQGLDKPNKCFDIVTYVANEFTKKQTFALAWAKVVGGDASEGANISSKRKNASRPLINEHISCSTQI